MGVRAVVSTEEIADIAFDKLRCHQFLDGIGLRAPQTFLSPSQARSALEMGEATLPFVLKPRWGTGSLVMDIATDAHEIALLHEHLTEKLKSSYIGEIGRSGRRNEILIQELIIGEEFGLDCVNDFDGNHRACFVRKKLSMAQGQTDVAVTVQDAQISEAGSRIARSLGHVGILDADVIRDGDGDVYVLDMNPRFSGGYPFSHAAGANIPAAMVAWAEGRPTDPAWFQPKPGVVSAKGVRILPSAT